MIVDIHDLRAGYGGQIALVLPLLQIAHGAHTLLLGASGCGKTTLLNVIAGITLAQTGRVSVNGTSLGALSNSGRDHFRGKNIGLVMQRLHLIGALTVLDNLRLAQRLAGLPANEAVIAATLQKLAVADKLKRYPRELSQGEAQRVAIARAVINRPALILADEPTSALDDSNCVAAIDLLFAQAELHGATLLVATHDARIKARFLNVVPMAVPA